jgi:hypothetical protein
LDNEFSTWQPHLQEIAKYTMPRNGRFLNTDRNKGEKKHNNILDNTALKSARILGAGLMSGATSPARPWFRLAVADRDLMRNDNVKLWLSTVASMMLDAIQRSNTYRAFHSMYDEIGPFGTAANILMDDFDRLIHNYPLTIGEYRLANNHRGEVDTLVRKFDKTVLDLVREFGYKNCSAYVKNAYDRGDYHYWVTVYHVVEPRTERNMESPLAEDMAFKSCYFEESQHNNKFLKNGGMKRFRVLAPRWSVVSGDVYGHGPGMESLGDNKQLQHQQLRKGQAIDFQVNPPLNVPTSYKNREVERFPGGINFVDNTANGIRSAYDVNINLQHLLVDIEDCRERIRQSYFTDIFMMLAMGSQTTMKTATEIAERHEEKMVMLGPVLERLHNEMLSPFIDMLFDRMIEAGVLPPVPEELMGQDLNVEFVSILSQAQRAVNTAGIDRLVMNLGSIAGFKPEILDKFDADEYADIYSDMLGVDPRLIVPDAKVALVRKARAEAQMAAAQQAQAAQAAETAKTLAGANTSGSNALTDLTQAFSGYTIPTT